jgi:outer membrane lipoprotein SlyB
VSSVRPASRIERKGSLTLSFDEIRIHERSYRLRASVVKALDAKMANDVTTIGAGAVIGGIVGGIIGGGKGAVVGVLVGGGGTMAATDGTEVDLPLGTVLRIRVDQPLELVLR